MSREYIPAGWSSSEQNYDGTITLYSRADMEAAQKRIATLEAQNELLRAVVVSAHAYVNASIYDVDPTSQAYQEWLAYLSKMKDAIDGGAMGEG